MSKSEFFKECDKVRLNWECNGYSDMVLAAWNSVKDWNSTDSEILNSWFQEWKNMVGES